MQMWNQLCIGECLSPFCERCRLATDCGPCHCTKYYAYSCSECKFDITCVNAGCRYYEGVFNNGNVLCHCCNLKSILKVENSEQVKELVVEIEK